MMRLVCVLLQQPSCCLFISVFSRETTALIMFSNARLTYVYPSLPSTLLHLKVQCVLCSGIQKNRLGKNGI